MESKPRILFLCTGNSARSQIAEGLLRSKCGGKMDVFSAGTNPKEVNPLSVQVMREIGIDISRHQSKDAGIFGGQKFDCIITVCNRAKESCPVFSGSRMIHWDILDPENLESFRKIRDELSARIDAFLKESMPL